MEENKLSTTNGNICTNCQADVEPGLKFCTSCGSEVVAPVSSGEGSVCSKCYADVEPGLKFCTSCGSEVVAPVSSGEGSVCSKCYADVEPGLKFCTSCGSEVVAPVSSGEGSVCSKCYADVEPGLKFCTSCGSKVEASYVAETICPQCYTDVAPGLKFCTECGTSMIQSEKVTTGNISAKLREKRLNDGKLDPPEDEITESVKTTGKGLMKGLGGFMSKAASEVNKGMSNTGTASEKKPRNYLNPGYLVCDSCEGYYQLQKGEKPDDFMDECECGGKYIHKMRL